MSDWAPIRYTVNGDVSIAYSTLGNGPIDLLFVGGFVSHLEIGAESERAQRFWERLASFSRLIAFDKRGLGLSDREAAPYTLEDVIDDALAVLDAVEARRVVVFGVSEGGSAAALLAATHPGRVQALVQFGTFPRLVRGPDYPDGLTLEALRGLERLLAESWGDPRSIDLWAPSLAHDPQEREWWGRMLRSGLSRGSLHRIEQMYEGVDVRPVLGAVNVPTLVLYRAYDRLVPPALSRAMAEGIPGARAVALPGEDHLYLGDDPDAMLDVVEEFVTGRPVTPVAERVLATVVFCDVVGSTGWRRVWVTAAGGRCWPSTIASPNARWCGTGVGLSRPSVTAASRRSTARPAPSGPRKASSTPRPRSGCSCVPASTLARSRCPGPTSSGWRSTLPPVSRPPHSQVRSWCPAPSKTSSSAPGCSSTVVASTRSKEFPECGACTPSARIPGLTVGRTRPETRLWRDEMTHQATALSIGPPS